MKIGGAGLPFPGIQGQATRLGDVLRHQDDVVAAVQRGNVDGLETRVDPVEVSGDPIDGQTFDQIQAAVDDRLSLLSLGDSEDFLEGHVGPVDSLVPHLGCGGDDVDDLHRNTLDALRVERGDEDRTNVGYHQEGFAVICETKGANSIKRFACMMIIY